MTAFLAWFVPSPTPAGGWTLYGPLSTTYQAPANSTIDLALRALWCAFCAVLLWWVPRWTPRRGSAGLFRSIASSLMVLAAGLCGLYLDMERIILSAVANPAVNGAPRRYHYYYFSDEGGSNWHLVAHILHALVPGILVALGVLTSCKGSRASA